MNHPLPATPATTGDTTLDRLLAWFLHHGGRMGAIAVQGGRGARGLFATRPIAPGERLLETPLSLAITPTLGRQTPVGQRLLARGAEFSERGWMALFLLHTRAHGGFWAPFVDSMPTSFDGHPLCFDGHEAGFVSNLFLVGAFIQDLQGQIEGEYQVVAQALDDTAAWSQADFNWASCCVLSRSFAIDLENGDKTVMLPVFEFTNHSYDTMWVARHAPATHACDAAVPIAEGQEIFCSYGDKSGQRLFSNYGFMVPDRRFDVGMLLVDRRSFVLKADLDSPAAREMLDVLRARAQGPDLPAPSGHAAPDRASEREALRQLLHFCRQHLLMLSPEFAKEDVLRREGRLTPGLATLFEVCRNEARVVMYFAFAATAGMALLDAPGPIDPASDHARALSPGYLRMLAALPGAS